MTNDIPTTSTGKTNWLGSCRAVSGGEKQWSMPKTVDDPEDERRGHRVQPHLKPGKREPAPTRLILSDSTTVNEQTQRTAKKGDEVGARQQPQHSPRCG